MKNLSEETRKKLLTQFENEKLFNGMTKEQLRLEHLKKLTKSESWS